MSPKSHKLAALALMCIGVFLAFSSIISNFITDGSYSEEGNWAGETGENFWIGVIGMIISSLYVSSFFFIPSYLFYRKSKKSNHI